MKSLDALHIEGLQRDASLAKYTSARLGGRADWLYLAKETNQELLEVVQTAWEEGLPVRILGGGANMLVSDKGVRGLVVVNRVTEIEFGDWHEGRNVSASGGTGLLRLARDCAARGLSGLEWAVGVPGTLGGAIVNNAGAHGSDLSQIVADVVVYDIHKGPQMMTNSELQYGYRHSALKIREDRHFVVLLATLMLEEDEPNVIEQRMEEFNAYRKRTQPPGASLGSIFKNPPDDYAGRLIEVCGLKGHQIGGVQVSPVHANFFVNLGEGSAQDYLSLIRYVQDVVSRKQGVNLELEIELLGEW